MHSFRGASLFMRVACLGLTAALLSSCATLGGRAREEARIADLVQEFKATMEAQDIDGQMRLFSEEYRGARGGKESRRAYLAQNKEYGVLAGIELLTDSAEIGIYKGTATVYPIKVNTAIGSTSLELRLTKEAGAWRITGLDLY